MHRYILKDGQPVPEPDVIAWARWMQDFENHCRIARTEIGDVHVSTVFLGVNHNFFGHTPILFETMIFGGEHDEYQERYYTLEEAMIGHERAVSLIKGEHP
jgi:hypothetical protein